MIKPFAYFGGKGSLKARLLELVPPGGRPYCGGASLFFARKRAPVEVLNDLGELLPVLARQGNIRGAPAQAHLHPLLAS